MKIILTLLSLIFMNDTSVLFDFNPDTATNQWRIVDDVVMGGRSDGDFSINAEGNGVFKGSVSLENNGGFSSLRHRFESRNFLSFKKFEIRLKGDGKKYQFRVKTSRNDYHSYIYSFTTSGEWQTIEIPFDSMYPAFRGRNLDMPNFPGEKAEEVAFLIGNKKPEEFILLIDQIEMR